MEKVFISISTFMALEIKTVATNCYTMSLSFYLLFVQKINEGKRLIWHGFEFIGSQNGNASPFYFDQAFILKIRQSTNDAFFGCTDHAG